MGKYSDLVTIWFCTLFGLTFGVFELLGNPVGVMLAPLVSSVVGLVLRSILVFVYGVELPDLSQRS